MNDNIIEGKIVNYIESHIDEDLSLDNIAKELNDSKFYFMSAEEALNYGLIDKIIDRR